jgi:hypothetical protein
VPPPRLHANSHFYYFDADENFAITELLLPGDKPSFIADDDNAIGLFFEATALFQPLLLHPAMSPAPAAAFAFTYIATMYARALYRQPISCCCFSHEY